MGKGGSDRPRVRTVACRLSSASVTTSAALQEDQEITLTLWETRRSYE